MLTNFSKNILIKTILKDEFFAEFLYNKKSDKLKLIQYLNIENIISCRNKEINEVLNTLYQTENYIIIEDLEKAIVPIDSEKVDLNNLNSDHYRRKRELLLFLKKIINHANRYNKYILFINPIDELDFNMMKKKSLFTDIIKKECENIFYTHLTSDNSLKINKVYGKRVDKFKDLLLEGSEYSDLKTFINLMDIKIFEGHNFKDRHSGFIRREMQKYNESEKLKIFEKINNFIKLKKENEDLDYSSFEKEYNKKQFLDSMKEVS